MTKSISPLLVLLLLYPIAGLAQPRNYHPNRVSTSLINRYQESISGLLSGDCRSYPSCSAYAKDAYANEAFVQATLMTTDRLIRCGNDHRLPKVRISGFTYAYDPVKFAMHLPTQRPAPDELLDCVNLTKLKTLRMLNQIEDATPRIVFLSQLLVDSIPRKCRDVLNVELSKSFRKLGEPDALIDTISNAHFRQHESSTEELIKIYLEIGNYPSAQSIANSSPYVKSEIVRACDLVNISFGHSIAPPRNNLEERYAQVLEKNPTLASSLGIIPGAGYLYCGQPESALSSVLLIGLFGGLAMEANKKEMPILSGISLLFGTSFYFGSIFGPARSLFRQRDNLRQELTEVVLR